VAYTNESSTPADQLDLGRHSCWCGITCTSIAGTALTIRQHAGYPAALFQSLRQTAIAHATATPPVYISQLLVSYACAILGMQGAAAATISNLSTLPELKQAIGATPGAAHGLVRLLTSGTREAQHSAATALSNLAAGSSTNKAVILECPGALLGLSQLLQSGDEAAQRAAATAITNLASAISNKVRWEKELTAAGGIAGLSELSGSSSASPEVRVAAAAALRRLGRMDKLAGTPCSLSPAPSVALGCN
jgi:hypothetical protein